MINPNEIKKLKKHAPWFLLIAIILCLAPSMLVMPEQIALSEAISKYDNTLKQCKKLRQKKLDYQNQALLSKNLKAENDKFLKAAINESELPNTILELHKMAASCGVVIESTSYALKENFETMRVKNYELKLELRSEYANLHKMLERIEQMTMPVVISGIRLADNQNYSITMRLMVK